MLLFHVCIAEDLYCTRGEMENRIKEVQLDFFGDRASCHTFRGNALRLWFAMAAQLLTVTIRNVGLVGTELARTQAGTLRNKLFKAGAIVSRSDIKQTTEPQLVAWQADDSLIFLLSPTSSGASQNPVTDSG
ncbi:MAG: hypothetical protein GY811_07515 [Myxococcales bacterium]|nr:hypothetical protein [Myxococcales bacterium]